MNTLELMKEIINEIDVNNGMAREDLKNCFSNYEIDDLLYEMEMGQEIRLLPLDKNLGTYYYQLPA